MILLLVLQEGVKQDFGEDILKVMQMVQDSIPEWMRQGIGGEGLGQPLKSNLAGPDLFCQ